MKDPRLCYVLGHYLNAFPGATIIRTRRNIYDVVASMQRVYGWSYIESLRETMQREQLLDIFLKNRPCFSIDMDIYQSADTLSTKLEGIVNA